MNDLAERERAGLSVLNDGSTNLTLSDDSANNRGRFAVSKVGDPSIVMFDRNANVRTLIVSPDGRPGITLTNDAGKTLWSVL